MYYFFKIIYTLMKQRTKNILSDLKWYFWCQCQFCHSKAILCISWDKKKKWAILFHLSEQVLWHGRKIWRIDWSGYIKKLCSCIWFVNINIKFWSIVFLKIFISWNFLLTRSSEKIKHIINEHTWHPYNSL